MKYRIEIDGLRAFALMPVILFHSEIKAFSGGFVGVDVFFVISGYLITTLIVAEMEADAFSLVAFYERRVRRILPALFFVMLCCAPVAWLLMRPSQLDEFARSLVSVCLFSSNFEFWRESGYFAPSAAEKPLLHTWSLSVEEQFYLLFPLLLSILMRFGRQRATTVMMLGIAGSLALSTYFSRAHPEANFYFFPTRAWELLIGGVSAMTLNHQRISYSKAADVLSSAGLLTIIACVFVLDSTVPFPGVYALAPTLGAALIIVFAVPGTLAHRVLGLRPAVAIGVISYSAYLWHQPLLAFARLYWSGGVSPLVQLPIALLSLPLAALTYVTIERPFRARSTVSGRALVAALPTCAAGVLCVAAAFLFHFGFSQRETMLVATENRISNNFGLSPECDYAGDFVAHPSCQTGPRPTLMIWGDSLAMHLVDGVAAGNPNRPLIQATRSVCGPLIGVSPMDANHPLTWANDCLRFNQSVFAHLKAHPEITDVVLSSLFTQYLDGDFAFVTPAGEQKADFDVAENAFLQTIDGLREIGKRVTIVSPPARNGSDFGQCLYMSSVWRNGLGDCDFSSEAGRKFAGETIRFLKAVESRGEARIVWLPNYTCSDATCFASRFGVFLYRDDRHLSREGSVWIGANTPAFHIGS